MSTKPSIATSLAFLSVLVLVSAQSDDGRPSGTRALETLYRGMYLDETILVICFVLSLIFALLAWVFNKYGQRAQRIHNEGLGTGADGLMTIFSGSPEHGQRQRLESEESLPPAQDDVPTATPQGQMQPQDPDHAPPATPGGTRDRTLSLAELSTVLRGRAAPGSKRRWTGRVMLWISGFWVQLVLICFVAFDMLNVGVGILLMFLYLFSLFVLASPTPIKTRTSRHTHRRRDKHPSGVSGAARSGAAAAPGDVVRVDPELASPIPDRVHEGGNGRGNKGRGHQRMVSRTVELQQPTTDDPEPETRPDAVATPEAAAAAAEAETEDPELDNLEHDIEADVSMVVYPEVGTDVRDRSSSILGASYDEFYLQASLMADDVSRKFRNRPYFFLGGATITIVITVLLCLATQSMCVDPYGPLTHTTTKFSRMLMEPICKPGPVPCFIYVTLPETSPATSLVINFHNSERLDQPAVIYDTISHANLTGGSPGYPMTASALESHLQYEDLDRYVHMAVLTALSPNTTYYFRAGSAKTGIFSTERCVRTPPNGGDIEFVAGGDFDTFPTAPLPLTSLAGSLNPHFCVLAGDYAFANGDIKCYRRWDLWLKSWEASAVTPAGCAVPFIAAIGNHEVKGGSSSNPMDAPFFLHYIPQHDLVNAKDALQRKTYHAHWFNHTVIVILDTNHVAAETGTQAAWLQRTLTTAANTGRSIRLASYHVPAYPAVKNMSADDSVAIRSAWESTFNQQGVTAALEGHEHTYKRSKKIKSGVPVADSVVGGTYYGGGGDWGRDPRAPTKWPYLEAVAAKVHILHVTVMEQGYVKIRAVSADGKVFDEVTLTALV